MPEDVGDDISDTSFVRQSLLAGDVPYHRVLDLLFLLDGANVLDAEWQHILVVDGIDDRIGVQLLAERLLGRPQIRLAAAYGVLGKNRGSGEAEKEITFEFPGKGRVHSSKMMTIFCRNTECSAWRPMKTESF